MKKTGTPKLYYDLTKITTSKGKAPPSYQPASRANGFKMIKKAKKKRK